MIYLYVSAVLISISLFLGALSALLFVGYKFLMAIHVDLRVIREYASHPLFKVETSTSPLSHQRPGGPIIPQNQTDGDFIFNTDEELALDEEVRMAKAAMGGVMSEEDEKELAAQIRQGGVTYKG